MIYPKFLQENDQISVPAPSAGSRDEIDKKRYKNAKKQLIERGYKIKLSPNINNNIKGRSADYKERAKEFNEMIEDESKLILCASGGEFLSEILPYIEFEKLQRNPKWVEGFSDPTGLLYTITTKYDIATIYGDNFKTFGMEKYHKSLKDNLEIIKGNIIEQDSFELYEEERKEKITGLEGYNLTNKVEWKEIKNRDVKIKGRVIAGCLDIITLLAGTKYDGAKEFNEKYKEDGIIWIFDNCELSKEQLILEMWKLNELEFFKYTKLIIFGRNGVETSYLEYDMKTAIEDSVLSKLNIPIIYDADISHKGPTMTIINGAIIEVETNNKKAKIKTELK